MSPPTDAPREESLWLATTPTTEYAPLDGGLAVDVAVIGGGITGLTTALHLSEAGREVAVLEANRIVEGVTGKTTAKITSQHGLVYDRLRSAFGRAKARQYADANEAAIDEIERRVEELDVDCQFQRTEAYTYTTDPEERDDLRDEVAAATELGLPASLVETTPLPVDVEAAVRFDDQASFHPRAYLLALADELDDDGVHVFERSRAVDLDAGSPSTVRTDRGSITADDVVVATHFPCFDRAGYFARMHPKLAYLLAVRIEGDPPDGMFYSTDSPPVTIRSGARGEDGEELLLVGGQSHKPGMETPASSERYRRCAAFARDHFDVAEIAYRWSTMDYTPVDSLPFVGKIDPLTDSVYVGTGFGGWGMTGGTAAGRILASLVVEGDHPHAAVFDPQRLTPGASTKRFVTGNAVAGVNFVGEWLNTLLSSGDLPETPDTATVSRQDGKPTGIYRDEEGEIHAVSAVCPHMGCVVSWNDADRTWDCPCHGSRFDYDGTVINGPAGTGLASRDR